jgi:hypothetical protein
MTREPLDNLLERLLSSPVPARAAAEVAVAEVAVAPGAVVTPEVAEMAGMLAVLGGQDPAGDAPRLDFDELYEHRFGRPTESQRLAVTAALAASRADREMDALMAGLPSLRDAEIEGAALASAGAFPAALRGSVLTAVVRPAGPASRLGDAARRWLAGVAETFDAFAVAVGEFAGDAAVQVVRLVRGEPVSESAEVAYAYDGSAVVEAETTRAGGKATGTLPRVRVEHGYLCLALSSDSGRGLTVSLVDSAGREVAAARPNDIGVVMFERLSPGTYGLRVERSA